MTIKKYVRKINDIDVVELAEGNAVELVVIGWGTGILVEEFFGVGGCFGDGGMDRV